ncbi:MAG: hypothetical protein K2W82_01075 [Candidatus Obscuribacterales bacterium]|nr:hypothetical protein [Candidatus Obscuribacterales bacterium]
MILLISSKDDVTTDFLVNRLDTLEMSAFRFNTEDLYTQYSLSYEIADESESYILRDKYRNVSVDLAKVSGAIFRRPKKPVIKCVEEELSHTASEIDELLRGAWAAIPESAWLNNPLNIWKANNKIRQLNVARKLGFNIPVTRIATEPQEILLFSSDLNEEIICKPLSHGLIQEQDEQIHCVFTSKITEADLDWLRKTKSIAPILVQQHIKKDVDIRVTVIGKKLFAAEIHSQDSEVSNVDWRKWQIGSVAPPRHECCILPKDISTKCLGLLEHFELNFGCIDLIRTPEGKFVFLEINPNGNWVWLENQLSFPLANEIIRLIAGRRANVRI